MLRHLQSRVGVRVLRRLDVQYRFAKWNRRKALFALCYWGGVTVMTEGVLHDASEAIRGNPEAEFAAQKAAVDQMDIIVVCFRGKVTHPTELPNARDQLDICVKISGNVKEQEPFQESGVRIQRAVENDAVKFLGSDVMGHAKMHFECRMIHGVKTSDQL